VGADVITLTFNATDAVSRARELMQSLPEVERVQSSEDEVVVYVQGGDAALGGFIVALNEAGLHPATVKLAEPSLDDVLMRQTGPFMANEAEAGEAATSAPARGGH